MAWWSLLKSFFERHFHVDVNTVRGNSPNIKIKAKNSIVLVGGQEKAPISIEKDGERISLNVDKLDDKQQEELRRIYRAYYEEEGELLKDNLLEYSSQLDTYKEENPDKETLAFFRDKLPSPDLEILKISLFMRARFNLNENVSKIKEDIIKRFGDRGGNIANLCTAGYFENFINPLWTIIHQSIKEKRNADEKFNEIYELIVRNGLLAVFVHHFMSDDKLSNLIQRRLDESKRYGFGVISDKLYIHALSNANVKTVKKWIQKSGNEIGAEIIAQEAEFITVSIPTDHLSSTDPEEKQTD